MKKIATLTIFVAHADEGSLKTAKELDGIYKENAKNIVFAASHIENLLAAGITRYFFGENYDARKLLDDLVVSTDSFSFSAKRKALLTILKLQGVVSGQECGGLERLLSKIIRYRNMFAHGTAVYSGTKCILRYFEGGKMEKEIDDPFLGEVEQQLRECFLEIERVIQLIKPIHA